MAPASLQRLILLAPDRIARAAAPQAARAEEVWMLRQSRGVRRSYVEAVLDGPAHPHAQEIWMLGQADDVRESYVREVLRPAVEGFSPVGERVPEPSGPEAGRASAGAGRGPTD